mmetsp:Transcript_11015/g.32868  ORF Transcript_11015/g.32868 Transcript_11015/m.32868 type:complete len:350 (-) Transcript_11015:1069-2118(-)
MVLRIPVSPGVEFFIVLLLIRQITCRPVRMALPRRASRGKHPTFIRTRRSSSSARTKSARRRSRRRPSTPKSTARKEEGKSMRATLGPRNHRHPEAVARVDGGARVGADLVRRVRGPRELEVEVAHEAGERHGGLHHGELVAHALARAAAEGQEGEVGRGLRRVERAPRPLGRVVAGPVGLGGVPVGFAPAMGVEGVRVGPVAGRPVDGVERDEHVRRARHRHAHARGPQALRQVPRVRQGGLGQAVLVHGAADEQRRLRVHAERLGHREASELERLDLLPRGRRAARGQRRVQLGAQLRQQVRILRELEDAPRERRGRRLVAGDEHGHEVVPQLRRGGLLAPLVHEKS